MLSEKPVRLRVWGALGCFTRHEFHVERVSYPVLTPSAARGILEAILMKPVEKPAGEHRYNKAGFRWHILRLGIVRKGVMMSLLRNELGYKNFSYGGTDISGKASEVRSQRHSLILAGGADAQGTPQNLEYIIEAALEVPEPLPHGETRRAIDVLAKYQHSFERRAAKGQCFHRPYFGCREFPCFFELVDDTYQPDASINEDFGMIFNDFDYSPIWRHWQAGKPRPPYELIFDYEHAEDNERETNKRLLRDQMRLQPIMFHAKANEGWIKVPRLKN